MQLTPRQCVTGRAILGWTAHELAKRAGIGFSTVAKFEQERSDLIRATERAIVDAFEREKVSFKEMNGEVAVLYPKRLDQPYLDGVAERGAAKLAALDAARQRRKGDDDKG
jgi:transcriptional regulator with XRE-family HTH domain